MLKPAISALSLATIAACSLLPAHATVFEYGVRQKKVVFKTNIETRSQAEWESKGSVRSLHLRCMKDSMPPPSNSRPQDFARAAAVVDFTKESQHGLQLSYFSFDYWRRQSGTVFKETTDPIVRVEYLDAYNGINQRMKTLPLTASGDRQFIEVRYDRDTLKKHGLDPFKVRIMRVAIVAKAKQNKYVDDYANVEVKNFRYKVQSNDKFLQPDEDLAIKDINSDDLIDRD